MGVRFGSGLLVLPLICVQGGQALQPETPIRNLSLVALDSRGQPVNDLTMDEITINEGGKTRKVAFMRHIERRLAPGAKLSPNEYSNRAGRVIPHATVILLDMMNQSFSTRNIAANQLTKFLQSAENTEYLYVYFLTIEGRLYTVRGLPGIDGPAPPATTEDGAPWNKSIKPIMDDAMRTVMHVRPIDMDVAVRVQLTYAALEALGRGMSAVPGRKNVVWITDGVPIALGPVRSDTGDLVDFTPWLRQLSLALDRAEIAIYPVPQIFIGSSDGPPDAPGVPRGGSGTGALSQETLNDFANMTGGRANGGKDIGAAISQAMNDARTSYQIGYYEPDENEDSKFHKLRVTCTRKGVRIQAKTGYYAWPEEPEAEAMQAIRNAISQPADAAEIGIRTTLTQISGSAESQHLNVLIDAKDVALLHESDKYSGHLSFVVAGYEAGGTAHASSIRSVDLSYTAAERDKVMAQGIDYTLDVPAGDNIASIRFIAFDDVSHSIGSVTIPVKVLH